MSSRPMTSDEARTGLYEIMQEDLPFEQKASKALELGENYLGVENGHLTRIDERINFWEAIASSDPPDGEFPAGKILDLSTTYCRRTIEKGSSIALSDAPQQGWADDPAFEKHGLHCYHGTPLSIDEDIVGTLCFVSREAREQPFSDAETLFAELTARMLENEMRLAQKEDELNLQSNLIGVLSRVLRHNLRNDLTVIRGQLTRLAEESDKPLLEAKGAVAKIDRLVDLASTARQIESIASSDLDHQPVDLRALVENVIERVQANYPDASFTIEAPDEVYVEAIPSLGLALEELIENAAKHSGATPSVTVEIEPTADDILISIEDNGPGLPRQELAVLRDGQEKPLIHGSGLGLWLTYWIVANHDGSIRTEVSDTGTKISIALPKTLALSEFTESESLLGKFHRQQDKFEAVFEESIDPIVIVDDEGHYLDVNESAADLIGLPKQELRGRQMRDFVPADMDFEEAWASLLESGGEVGRGILQRADGTERIVEHTAVPDIVSGQHLLIFRDITDRIERQEELRETTEQLEAIVDASPDPIIALDAEGRVQRWNEAAENVFGYQAAEVLDQPLPSINIYPEGEHRAFEENLDRALAGESFTDLKVRRLTKAGETVYLSVSTAPLRAEDGTVSGVVTVAKDITEREERTRELERLQELFTDVERIGNLGVWEFNQSGGIRWSEGTRRIHEVDEDFEPTVEKGIEFFHPEDQEAVKRAVSAAIENREAYDVEARLITAEGNERWVRTVGKPLDDSEEEITVRGYIQDITDQKRDAKQLGQAPS